MRKVLLTLLAVGSLASFASETIKNPDIKGAQVNCNSEMDAVCRHLGHEEMVEYTCKRPLRTLTMNTNIDSQNGKSVSVKSKPCQEQGLGIGVYEAMQTVDSTCSTYAKNTYENRKTRVLKSIVCK